MLLQELFQQYYNVSKTLKSENGLSTACFTKKQNVAKGSSFHGQFKRLCFLVKTSLSYLLVTCSNQSFQFVCSLQVLQLLLAHFHRADRNHVLHCDTVQIFVSHFLLFHFELLIYTLPNVMYQPDLNYIPNFRGTMYSCQSVVPGCVLKKRGSIYFVHVRIGFVQKIQVHVPVCSK